MSNTAKQKVGFWMRLWQATCKVAGVKNAFAKAGLMALVSLGLYGFFALVATGFFRLLPVQFLEPGANLDENFDPYDLFFRAPRPYYDGRDDDIVLLDVLEPGRAQLAALLDSVLQCEPVLVGLDFPLELVTTKDTAGTAAIKHVLQRHTNVVVVNGVDTGDLGLKERPGHYADPVTTKDRRGIALLQEGDPLGTVRFAAVWRPGPANDTLWGFSAQMFRAVDPTSFRERVERGDRDVRINYRYGKQGDAYYPTVSYAKVMAMSAADRRKGLKGKIVIMGALRNPQFMDMHYTPLNTRPAGRSVPDMTGLEIHARTLGMFMRNDTLRQWSWKRSLLLAWVVSFVVALVLLSLSRWKPVLGFMLKVTVYLVASVAVFAVAIALFEHGVVVRLGMWLIPVWLVGEAKDLLDAISASCARKTVPMIRTQ